jgi:hypothetical protein
MERLSDVEAWSVIRRAATITVIGAIASFACSVSPLNAQVRVMVGRSSLDVRTFTLPEPNPWIHVRGTIGWETQEACGFGDRAAAPSIVFSDDRGNVVGVIRPGRVTFYAQRAPFPGTGLVLCSRSAPYSGTVGRADVYEVTVEGTTVARTSLVSLAEHGFALDVMYPLTLSW